MMAITSIFPVDDTAPGQLGGARRRPVRVSDRAWLLTCSVARAASSIAVLAMALAVSTACTRSRDQPGPVASLSMTCVPIAEGVRCRVLALSRDVSQAPREVTGAVAWRLSGSATGEMSPPGVIRRVVDGNLDVTAQYADASAHAAVRLAPGTPGQLLGGIHRTVFAEDNTRLFPVPEVQVGIVGADRVETQTRTRADGTFELVWIAIQGKPSRACSWCHPPVNASRLHDV